MTIINQYTNGNCRVTLHDDGTKTREWPDGEEPRPVLPESIDLKITDWCDQGCPFCHEDSSPQGGHADLAAIREILAGAQPGMEVAIGGGDPLSHPDIEIILSDMKRLGAVANLTVRAESLIRRGVLLRSLRLAGLVHGIGISGNLFAFQFLGLPPDETVVAHRVVGVDPPIQALPHTRVLVLGYKRRGRGATHKSGDIAQRIAEWRFWTPHLLSLARDSGAVIAFDNLALKQLGVRELVPDDVWQAHYMGDDGQFTMFIDAVADAYAASSTDDTRCPRAGRSLKTMFADVRTT